MDCREDIALQFQQIIEPLLYSSLGDRISDMCFTFFQESVGIGETQEPFTKCLIGLKLNAERSNMAVERGPIANLPEVFYNFLY